MTSITRRVAACLIVGVLSAAVGCSGTPTTPTVNAPAGAQSRVVSMAQTTGTPLPPISTEVTLTTPAGLAAGGCISMADLASTPSLDWTVQALPGHPDAVTINPIAFHKELANCGGTDDQARDARRLDILGHSQFAPAEEGTATVSWLTDRCRDGGRFEIDVVLERLQPSEEDSDRMSNQVIVNCGFDSPPGL